MIGWPVDLAETPILPTGFAPAAADVLSLTLDTFRVRGAALLHGEYSAPWAWEAPSAADIGRLLHGGKGRLVVLHTVVEGRCWLALPDGGRLAIERGDIVGFPHGDAHRMGNGAGAKPFAILPHFPKPPWRTLPTIRRADGGEVTRILCVYLWCEALLFNPLLDGLPAVLHLRPSSMPDHGRWIEANLAQLVLEASSALPGSAVVTSRLTESLFVALLRDHAVNGGTGRNPWLAALGDRHVARALALLHGAPRRDWTAATLARETGLSRSALGARFRRRLGMGPLEYLARWRLQLGAAALRRDGASVSVAADAAGYASAEAFSRAFRRVAGCSPAAWRDGVCATLAPKAEGANPVDGALPGQTRQAWAG